jgi:tetratricopeptide (TPR) repeat protein
MGFAGELTTIGLSEVFQNVAFNRLTGVLTVSERDRRASVYLEEGTIHAFRPEGERSLDYVAIAERAHAATAETLRQASRRLRRRTLKEALRATGKFDEDRFDAAVQAAIKEEVILLFSWREASFVFEEGRAQAGAFDREQVDCNISLDPHVVIVEAARRVDEWDAISHQIRSEGDIFLPAKPLDDQAPAAWQEIVSRLDGTRDVRRLFEELPFGRFEVLRHVAALSEQGLIVRAAPSQLCALARAAEEERDLDRAVRQLEAALAMDPSHLEARQELIRLYERAGRRAEAAGEYKRLGQSQEAGGDPIGALESYGKATGLVPYDVEALERIAAIHEARQDPKEFMRAGLRLAEALSTQSLLDEALEVYKRLLANDQESVILRESLAATYIKLHESKLAARELLFLAQRAWDRRDFDRSLHYYRNVLAVDRECEEAAKRITEIETTRHHARGRRRRRRVLLTVFAVLFGCGLWQGTREWFAAEALHQASRAALGGLVRRGADDAVAEAIDAFARVNREFPLTVGADRAEETVRGLLLDALGSIRVEAQQDPAEAEKQLRRLSRVKWPEDLKRLWAEGRDRALEVVAQNRSGN